MNDDANTTEKGDTSMVARMLAIEAEHKRAEREDDLSTTLTCPEGIHGFYQRTPNTKCPWCEWENAEQQRDELLAEVERRIEVARSEHWQEHLRLHPLSNGSSCPRDYGIHDAFTKAASIVHEVRRDARSSPEEKPQS